MFFQELRPRLHATKTFGQDQGKTAFQNRDQSKTPYLKAKSNTKTSQSARRR